MGDLFDFVNVPSPKTPDKGQKRHDLYTFVNKDRFQTIWVFRKGQKDSFTEDATYIRVK